jgi:RimJ/RimL family protein N-acetyltransferase
MAALRVTVTQYLAYLKDLPLGYYRDDAAKNVPLVDILMSQLQDGELYFAFSKAGDFVAMGAITNIAYGRSGYITAIAHPQASRYAIGKATGELLIYAFRDFGNTGLGLKKLKAEVAQPNGATFDLLVKIGFETAGRWQGEVLHGGVPHDMLLLELLNPKYFAVEKQVINGTSAESTDIPGSRVHVSGTGELVDSGSGGGNEADWPASEPGDGVRTVLVEPESIQRVITGPIGRAVRSAVDAEREQLVHAERGDAGSGTGSEPDATVGAELW